MSVTSGFFNSVNHDRLYDAEQISSMFDGIITDGIYQGIGDAFIVKPYSELNNTVTVGTGRAWFDHTWTKNDTELPITLEDPNVLYDRIDAIVIDVDRRQDVRANSIKVVKGTVSEFGATKPSLIEEELHNQYPLAYVTVKAGSAAPIQAQYIENAIGQTKTPLVAGVLDHMDITMFVQQMEDEFNTWFEGLKDVVSGDAITNLQQQVNEIKEGSPVTKKTVMDIVKNGNPSQVLKTITLGNGLYPKNITIPGDGNDDNTTFSTVIEAGPQDRTIILPDGKIARFGCLIPTAFESIDSYGENDNATYTASIVFYTVIYTEDSVGTESHTLITKNYSIAETGGFTSAFQTFGYCYASNIQADSYPVKLTLSSVCTVSDSGYYGSKTCANVCFVSNVTIDSNGVVSFTNSVSNSSMGGDSDIRSYDAELGAMCAHPALDDNKNLITLNYTKVATGKAMLQAVKINSEGVASFGAFNDYTTAYGTIVVSGNSSYGFSTPESGLSKFIFRETGNTRNYGITSCKVNNNTLAVSDITFESGASTNNEVPSSYASFRSGESYTLKPTNVLYKKTVNGMNTTENSLGNFVSPAFSMGLDLMKTADSVFIADYKDIKVAYLISGNTFRAIYYDENDKIGAYDYLHDSISMPSVNAESLFRNEYRQRSYNNVLYLLYDNFNMTFSLTNTTYLNGEHTYSLVTL